MDDYDAILGKDVYGQDDEKIGTVDSLYLANNSDEPLFVTVKTGWMAGSSFVPLAHAEISDDRIVVPYAKDTVKNAPNIEHDKELSSDEENRLYAHYDMTEGDNEAEDETDEIYEEDDDDEYTSEDGQDVSGPNTDDAMTRSEEELNVGTRTEESGRYRLRKYVVTDNVTKTVPVEREEVRVEREPITDENRDRAMSGPELSDEEHEVVTHAEVPTVDKRVVPKERVKLDKNTVTGEESVDEEVRKEEIDLEKDGERQ
jgi:uncharacterized protein (TIGR02271 family)